MQWVKGVHLELQFTIAASKKEFFFFEYMNGNEQIDLDATINSNCSQTVNVYLRQIP